MSPGACSTSCAAGPLQGQAEDVLAMLTDPSRCRVMLVTLAEETPVNEVVETAFALEDKVGVDLGPVVVNGLYPVLDGPRRRPGRRPAPDRPGPVRPRAAGGGRVPAAAPGAAAGAGRPPGRRAAPAPAAPAVAVRRRPRPRPTSTVLAGALVAGVAAIEVA